MRYGPGTTGMLLSLEDFRDQAQAAWNSCTDLWTEYDADDELIHDRHALHLPEQMLERSGKIFSHIAAHKLDLAVSLLTEPGGPDIRVIAGGTSGAASTARETVQECVGGILAYWDKRINLYRRVTRDNVYRLGAFLVIHADPDLYKSKPYSDDDEETEVTAAAAEGGATAAKRRARELRRANDRYKAREMPVLFDLLPASGCVLQPFGAAKPETLWSFTAESVKSVLSRFTDKDGDPLATQLAESVKNKTTYNSLADDAEVVVVTRIDREHVQRAVLAGGSFMVPQDRQWQSGTEYSAEDELLDDFEHHMECVPVAYFPGRQYDEREPAKAFHGFVQAIRPLAMALDDVRTQRHSITRTIAWPSPIAYENGPGNSPTVANEKDQPDSMEIVEGAINFLPGTKRIEPMQWIAPEALAFIEGEKKDLLEAIELLTLPATASGASTSSGYQQALTQAQAELVLEPNANGLKQGWETACRLILQAAMCVIDETDEPVLVHHVDREERKYVQLTGDLVDDDWQFEVTVKTRPMGGEYAQLQAIKMAEDSGYLSHEEATEKSGNKRPQRTFRQIRHEQQVNSPPVQEFITQQGIAGAIPELAANPVGAGPENPMIPGALANVIGTANAPKAQARLPEGPFGQAGLPGANGNLQQPAPVPGTGVSNGQANLAGMAQTSPGGGQNQDIINAAFGGG